MSLAEMCEKIEKEIISQFWYQLFAYEYMFWKAEGNFKYGFTQNLNKYVISLLRKNIGFYNTQLKRWYCM